MVKQNITADFDFNSFYKMGALLQIAPNQFKLISGPFRKIFLSQDKINEGKNLIYQPYFWDFLHSRTELLIVYEGAKSAVLTREELLEQLEKTPYLKPKLAWQNAHSEDFRNQFCWSQEKFGEKKILKTVPIISQKTKTNFGFENLIWSLIQLIQAEHFGWTYGFWQDKQGYLGQSPELILEWNEKEKVLKSTALAGTMTNTETHVEKILQDQKIKQEHEIVVADIQETFHKCFQNKKINTLEKQVLKLKHLLHLKTDITCQNVSFVECLEFLKAIHPTAALGVYPRISTTMNEFSKFNLQKNRCQFAAPFAFIQKEHVLSVAAIRNFYFSEDEITIYSGCGVTQESHYESELLELESKRESVKRMAGILE